MLEPLGVSEECIMEHARPLIDQGHTFVYCGSKLSEEEKQQRAADADVLMIANSPLSAKVIECASRLKMISVGFTGVDHVPMDLCAQKGICVCNAQGYATDSTGELAVGLMLASLRNVVPYDAVVRQGGTLAGYTSNTLRGKTVGIFGTGAIGKKVAALVRAFGCELLGYSRHEDAEAKKLGVAYTTLEDLFRRSDIVTLHAPLTAQTRGVVNRALLDVMKPTAILINCARGPLVDAQALADALNEGRIAKAAVDVFDTEPPVPADNPLLHARNLIMTPHIGFYTEESLAARADIVFDNVAAWMKGTPINVKQ